MAKTLGNILEVCRRRHGSDELLRIETALSGAWAGGAQRYAAHSKVAAKQDSPETEAAILGCSLYPSILGLCKAVGYLKLQRVVISFPTMQNILN